MKINEAIVHYRDGTATEQERQQVEEELEKQQLLAELMDSQWEENVFTSQPENPDYKQVKKSLRRRNIALVATSLALVCTILLGIWGKISRDFPDMVGNAGQVYSDQVSKQYPSPNISTYCEYASDLHLTLAANTELFHAGWTLDSLYATDNGLGNYQLTIRRTDNATGDPQYLTGSLQQGVLDLPQEYYSSNLAVNIFDRATYPYYAMSEDAKANTLERLKGLPEFIQLKAAVSFPEDLSMEELLDFSNRFPGGIIWTAIRISPEDEQLLPLAGMDAFSGGRVYDGINDAYPCFDIHTHERTAENLEAHFRSLLRYSADRAVDGTGLELTHGDACYYEAVLEYVETEGVYSYGCIVTATADQLLQLLEDGVISQAWILDADLAV